MFKSLYTSVVTIVGLCIIATSAYSAEWKFNNGLPEGRGESKQLETFAADVADLTGGSLKIDVFRRLNLYPSLFGLGPVLDAR